MSTATTGIDLIPKRFEVVQHRAVELTDVDETTGEVRLRLVPYNVEARLGVSLWETFERGAFAAAVNAPTRVKSWLEHGGPVIGCARQIEDLPDGSYGTFRFASTAHAQEARTLVVEKIIEDVSIEFRPIREHMKARRAPDGVHVSHSRGHLLGAALVAHGVYGEVGSLVLSARGDDGPTPAEERIAALKALSA